MVSRLCIGLIVFLIFGCTKQKNTSDSLLDFIPKNAAIVIKINDLNGFKSELKNNGFISKTETFEIYKSIHRKITPLRHVESDSESLLAFSELGANNFEFMFVANSATTNFNLDSHKNTSRESIVFEGHTIVKYGLEEDTYYGLEYLDKMLVSSSKVLLENLIKYFGLPKKAVALTKLYEVAGASKTASIFIDLKNSDPLFNSILKAGSESRLSNFSDWISIDVHSSQTHLALNGIAIANDSIKNFLNLFKGTNPLINTIPSLAPINADGILTYSFDDYGTFSKNQRQYFNSSVLKDSLFNTVEEIGLISQNGKKAIVLNTFGSDKITEYIHSIRQSESEYQGNQIITLNKTDFLNVHLEPIITDFTANFCAIIENAFIFSTQKNVLQTIINHHKSGSTFEKTDVFASAKEVLANESTILFVSNSKGIEELLTDDFSKAILRDFKKAGFDKNTFAAQVVADQGFFHTNLVIRQIGRKSKINTVSPLFTVQLDGELANSPQFVTNHRTLKKEVVVQDQENNLYLISTKGKVLWKKKLNSQIQGKIHQVDLYKNKRLQLAFTTNDQFLILDRNGKEVSPFGKKFEGGNLNELAVFDYDNRKDYRFVVTQGEKAFMYNNTGNIVDGFKYTRAESPILDAPKHIRMAKKDYLVFKLEDGSLKILNRIGDIRVKVNEKIDFSTNEVYLYKNKFIVTDKEGVLYQIGTNGKVNKTALKLNEDHGMDATGKSFVYVNDNVLNIKGKKVELDFGVYSPPKIFYLYDKIYVGVTDIQNQKIHLYDSQAKPIQNFPVFGSSSIDITDMENDRKLELVTRDQDNSIIVYQLN